MTRWTIRTRRVAIVAIAPALLLATLVTACGWGEVESPHAVAGHRSEKEEPEAEGPNGGRLLKSGAFELEIGIFEAGIPAEYRAWAWNGGPKSTKSKVRFRPQAEIIGSPIQSHH